MLDLDNISHYRIMTFTQGYIAKVKVTVYTWQKMVVVAGVFVPLGMSTYLAATSYLFIWRLPRVAAATYLHVSGECNVIISRPLLECL